jgi:glycosyltransferase involved in cell wall biosynthesis
VLPRSEAKVRRAQLDLHFAGGWMAMDQEVAAHISDPTDWPEPFGLIEAMACGTPVLAFRCGAVPEIVEGIAGMIVETVEEAVAAIPELFRA